ncbi:MAG: type VI secretion system ATPase TssH, partial [Chitinophagaceae bacterium]
EIKKIVKIQFHNIQQLAYKNNILIEFSDTLIQWLAENGYDPEMGARPLKRLIQKEIINLLSKKIISGNILKSKPVKIDVLEDKIVIFN